MKKLVGVSLLSAMLILGQPLMAFADTTGSRMINFEDIETIITEQNLEVQMNENERLKAYLDFSTLKRDIREIEDGLEDIDEERDRGGSAIGLGAEKRILLDTLKQLERTQVDRPTLEAMADLNASIKNVSQIRLAEGKFIGYNQSKLGSADISMAIDNLQKQLFTMQLQESLGLVSHNSINDLETKLVDMQTKLQSTKFQQDSIERELKTMLNDQENIIVIEGIPSDEDFVIKDKDADLEKALENSYSLKLLEQQIVIAQSALDRAKKDNGMSSKQYKKANYDLTNANLKLNLQKEALKTGYYTMVDNIANVQSDLRLAQQSLEDQKVKLSEAQLKMGLGMISKLEVDNATTNYQVQENAVKQKQIDLFNAKCNYEWFLKGISGIQ
ncbi:TolC family protein [Desulfosporosinus youngiae]|uniref:Outer membrane protein n=1 Tax=Desulfosporosinus youngiae DSM 17734 TaxID=768710 RepID=H5XZJ6_9FIRM|nr:TolC family protein [Desulfosporosinus youngiae]EHQ91970.1 hypothetical protein DesyoDRAFT_5035 [Desulfosporosinus youngiae DSM 17734]